MLKTKSELSNRITIECRKHLADRIYIQSISQKLYDKYNIPYGVSSDILTLRVDPETQTEQVLYYVLTELNGKYIKDFYVQKEIDKYEKTKYVIKKINFPLKFKMVQVTSDQWIGKITAKELSNLRNAHLINYNENTQRSFKRTIAGEVEYYQIFLNKNTVKEICSALDNNSYIPSTLTLNMPKSFDEDSNSYVDFYYDERTNELIINDISAFDITDGYHRYIALCNESMLNKNFDYEMELRITWHSEEKANQFTWQEDQKNKLDKIDTASMNYNNPANQVVQTLKERGTLREMISRNNGKINEGTLSVLISLLFFDKNKKANTSDIIKKSNLIRAKFNSFFECNPDSVDMKWDNVYTLCVMYAFSKNNEADIEFINSLYQKAKHPENKNLTFEKRSYSTADITRLEKLIGGV